MHSKYCSLPRRQSSNPEPHSIWRTPALRAQPFPVRADTEAWIVVQDCGNALRQGQNEVTSPPETPPRTSFSDSGSAHCLGFGLQRNEILLGLGENSNAALNAVDMLTRRHIVRVGHDGAIWARHRVIAEVITAELEKAGQIKELLQGLAHVAATQISPTMSRSARPWRLLRLVINHDFLIRAIGADAARNLYGELEGLLRWDYHFWLQRGSLEVEVGDLALAENFLNQASGLAPTDSFVETEYAYLLLRKAIENPNSSFAPELVREATDTLTSLISRVGDRDVYPYHVLGSQGIAWTRRGIVSTIDKDRFLRGIISHIEDGCRNHPRAAELKSLLEALKREQLEAAVPSQLPLIRPS